MQILFAAPFLLAAALAFTILAAVPRWRRWAIPIPTGIIASGPCLLAIAIIEILAVRAISGNAWPGRWANILYIVSSVVGGIFGGVAAGIVTRLLTCVLPRPLLRAALTVAAWCSYFVLFTALDIAATAYWHLHSGPASWIVGASLTFIGAWLVASNPESFRSSSFRWPIGSRLQSRASRGSLEKLKKVLDKVSDSPAPPEDRI
ncbi:MAG: hypothetical protein WBW84_09725 [Acidobacteriaceae bacterium]